MASADRAEAKDFNYGTRSFAAFVRGGAGLSQVAQDMFANAPGTAGFDDSEVKANVFAELGAQYSSGRANFRFGLEALRPKEMMIDGKNAGGTKLYTLTSSIFAYSPTITMEYIYSTLGPIAFYATFGIGYSFVTFENKYEMVTPAATVYNEKGSGSAPGGTFGFGFEILFVDNATFSLDFGYRYLVVKNFKHTASGTLPGGSVTKGDAVENADGDPRRIDLGGLSAGLTLRFYIN